MRIKLSTLLFSLVASAFLAVSAAWAHHSFAMFDLKTETEINGVVTEFQWTNPHVWIQLDSTDKNGKVVHWSVEAGAPSGLARAGWKRKTFVPGDKIKLVSHPVRNGSAGGALVAATLPDGTVLYESTATAAKKKAP